MAFLEFLNMWYMFLGKAQAEFQNSLNLKDLTTLSGTAEAWSPVEIFRVRENLE